PGVAWPGPARARSRELWSRQTPALGSCRPGVGDISYRPGGEWEGPRQRALSADPVGVALGRSRKAGEVGDTDQRAVEDDRARSHQAPETPRDVDSNGPDAGGDLLFAEALAGKLHPLPGADPFGDSLLVEQPRDPGSCRAERKALGEVHDARRLAAHGLDQLEGHRRVTAGDVDERSTVDPAEPRQRERSRGDEVLAGREGRGDTERVPGPIEHDHDLLPPLDARPVALDAPLDQDVEVPARVALTEDDLAGGNRPPPGPVGDRGDAQRAHVLEVGDRPEELDPAFGRPSAPGPRWHRESVAIPAPPGRLRSVTGTGHRWPLRGSRGDGRRGGSARRASGP